MDLYQHFNPDSSLFRPSIRHKIVLSDIGLLLNAAILFMVFRPFGLATFFKLYFVPYLVRCLPIEKLLSQCGSDCQPLDRGPDVLKPHMPDSAPLPRGRMDLCTWGACDG
jgi:hypothetical protein